jgi:hypothetical protein
VLEKTYFSVNHKYHPFSFKVRLSPNFHHKLINANIISQRNRKILDNKWFDEVFSQKTLNLEESNEFLRDVLCLGKRIWLYLTPLQHQTNQMCKWLPAKSLGKNYMPYWQG